MCRHGLTVYPNLVLNLEFSCFLPGATIPGRDGWVFCFFLVFDTVPLFFFPSILKQTLGLNLHF